MFKEERELINRGGLKMAPLICWVLFLLDFGTYNYSFSGDFPPYYLLLFLKFVWALGAVFTGMILTYLSLPGNKRNPFHLICAALMFQVSLTVLDLVGNWFGVEGGLVFLMVGSSYKVNFAAKITLGMIWIAYPLSRYLLYVNVRFDSEGSSFLNRLLITMPEIGILTYLGLRVFVPGYCPLEQTLLAIVFEFISNLLLFFYRLVRREIVWIVPLRNYGEFDPYLPFRILMGGISRASVFAYRGMFFLALKTYLEFYQPDQVLLFIKFNLLIQMALGSWEKELFIQTYRFQTVYVHNERKKILTEIFQSAPVHNLILALYWGAILKVFLAEIVGGKLLAPLFSFLVAFANQLLHQSIIMAKAQRLVGEETEVLLVFLMPLLGPLQWIIPLDFLFISWIFLNFWIFKIVGQRVENETDLPLWRYFQIALDFQVNFLLILPRQFFKWIEGAKK